MGFFDTALGGIVGGILGDTVGSAVNSAFDLNSYEKKAEIDYNYTKKLWDYQMQNKHQLEVGDLEAAGLNKMLSATNGQAVNATPIGGSSSDNRSNLGQTAIQLAMDGKKAEIQDKLADIELKKAVTDEKRLDIEEYRANSERIRMFWQNRVDNATIGFLSAQTGKSIAETHATYESIDRDWQEAISRIGLNNAQAYASYEQAKLYRQQIVESLERAGLSREQAEYYALSSEEIQKKLNDPDEKLRRFYRTTPLGLITGIYKNVREDIIGGNVGASMPVGPKGMRVGAHY